MTKMLRLLQTARLKNSFMKYLVRMLGFGIGLERLLSLLVTFFLVQHVTACIWYAKDDGVSLILSRVFVGK